MTVRPHKMLWGRPKLTVEQVLEIRASTETNVALGKKYGVTDAAISLIRTRQTWKHVPPQEET